MSKKSWRLSSWKPKSQSTNRPAGGWAAAATCGCNRSRRRTASPMMPLESSARRMTVTALAIAFCVTVRSSAGSWEAMAASRMSTASFICLPWAFAALHRRRSARLRISGSTASASTGTGHVRAPGQTIRSATVVPVTTVSPLLHPLVASPSPCISPSVSPHRRCSPVLPTPKSSLHTPVSGYDDGCGWSFVRAGGGQSWRDCSR
jgi:hypothetical protein